MAPKRTARSGDAWAVEREGYTLDTRSRIGVIGGGPAGSFFNYFLLTMASRIEPPPAEKRIAAVHRGAGPRGLVAARWHGRLVSRRPTYEEHKPDDQQEDYQQEWPLVIHRCPFDQIACLIENHQEVFQFPPPSVRLQGMLLFHRSSKIESCPIDSSTRPPVTVIREDLAAHAGGRNYFGCATVPV